jgi:RimJ/RimL family protein N-acetyltransferase/ubiquinone/menaquinone biosynthesis C-methylase UbiE
VSDAGTSDAYEFATERLDVGPWHAAAHRVGRSLADVVAEILNARTTVALPESWRGDFSIDRANVWIGERDRESPTLLAVETAMERPVGLVVLAEDPIGESAVDLRIGYVIAEDAWGRGLATELVAGLIDWARTRPSVHTLTGGVDPANQASVRVLEKSGFERVSDPGDGTATYQLDLQQDNEWDQYAESWDADVAVRAYSSAAFSSLQEVLRGAGITVAGMTVIDFGCGTGLLTERLVAAGAIVTAVDTSTAMLDVLEAKVARHGWSTVRTGTRLPSNGSTFDLVVCSSVCAFLDDYPGTVAELVARLRCGGLFVQWDWERDDDEPLGLTIEEIRTVLTEVGLVDIAVTAGFDITVDGQNMAPLIGHGRRPPGPGTDAPPNERAENAPTESPP